MRRLFVVSLASGILGAVVASCEPPPIENGKAVEGPATLEGTWYVVADPPGVPEDVECFVWRDSTWVGKMTAYVNYGGPECFRPATEGGELRP
jgi:hypothetical protein